MDNRAHDDAAAEADEEEPLDRSVGGTNLYSGSAPLEGCEDVCCWAGVVRPRWYRMAVDGSGRYGKQALELFWQGVAPA